MKTVDINSFQLSVAVYMKASHLFCFANQMTGFYMECNTGLKWVKKRYWKYGILNSFLGVYVFNLFYYCLPYRSLENVRKPQLFWRC